MRPRGESVQILSGTQVTRWAELEADLNLSRAWFGTVSVTRQRGPMQDADELFLLFTYRF